MAQLLIPWFRAEPWRFDLFGRGLTIAPFAVLVLTASMVGLMLALGFARRNGRSIDLTLSLALYLVAFSYPISCLFNGLVYKPEVLSVLVRNPGGVGEVTMGWSMYGGIFGALVGALVWRRLKAVPLLPTGDGFAWAGPFAWTIARVGCFVRHDHPGKVSDFVLAVADYEVGAPPYPPRHDLGLYDAIVLATIAVVFAILTRRPRVEGFYVAALPLLYTPCRFALDFLRAPVEEGGDVRYAGLTPGQYASVVVFLLGLALALRLQRQSGDGRPNGSATHV